MKACDNIPYIKPESHATEDTKYRFPEVQDAMKLGQSFAENKGLLILCNQYNTRENFSLSGIRLCVCRNL